MADPTMPSDPTAGAGIAPDTDDQGTDDQAGGMVLCTVMVSQDGTYTLIAGDEDEGGSDSGDGSDSAPDQGAGASGSPGVPGGDGGDASQGQQFDSVGALLKGILDLVKQYESSARGAGSDQDNFTAGFSGGQVGAGDSANPIRQKF